MKYSVYEIIFIQIGRGQLIVNYGSFVDFVHEFKIKDDIYRQIGCFRCHIGPSHVCKTAQPSPSLSYRYIQQLGKLSQPVLS